MYVYLLTCTLHTHITTVHLPPLHTHTHAHTHTHTHTHTPSPSPLPCTDGALYNIDPASMKVRRRISLSNISHVSISLLSDNFFVVHVPLEYDYLLVSGRKTEIISVMRIAYLSATGEELNLAMQNM